MRHPLQTLLSLWIAAILCTLAQSSPADPAVDAGSTWHRWEHVLTSQRDYKNPCTDVVLAARFVGPGNQVHTNLGFWDGDRSFVIRSTFPTPGDWHWQTLCSDTSNTSLHTQSGIVRVSRSTGSNPIVRHGYLRVSGDGRLLVHADSTPFLWIGDTCWAAPVHATAAEWRHYVANRSSLGYSVLQVSIAPDWAIKTASEDPKPFLSTLPDITKPNPRFFRRMDQMLAEANDRGLVVMMCGLMETPHRYPPPEQTAILSRYIAARYSSYEVIFSPSFDSGIHEAETLAAARAVRWAAPQNLLTMHMGTGVEPRFHAADWLSFDMFQSGHNGGDAARQSSRAVSMPAEILSLAGRKPVINGEAIYEGDLGGAYDVRRTAWLSFLSGASGYTAGINQVYAWKPDAIAHMNVPSSGQIATLGRFLRAIPWWDLNPAPGRILNQPADRAALMAFALTTDRQLGVAYLPRNDSLTLDLQDFPSALSILWINPATGQSHPGTPLQPSTRTTIKAPDGRDWVLLLTAPNASQNRSIQRALDKGRTRINSSRATLTFGPRDSMNGLVQKSPADGVLVTGLFKGKDCAINENPGRNRYLYIDIDDRLAFRGAVGKMRMDVQLHSDKPLDAVQLQFDSTGPAQVSNIYHPVSPTSCSRHGDWTSLTFEAPTPYLGNRQNSGADFRLYLGTNLCHVASIKVTLEPAAR